MTGHFNVLLIKNDHHLCGTRKCMIGCKTRQRFDTDFYIIIVMTLQRRGAKGPFKLWPADPTLIIIWSWDSHRGHLHRRSRNLEASKSNLRYITPHSAMSLGLPTVPTVRNGKGRSQRRPVQVQGPVNRKPGSELPLEYSLHIFENVPDRGIKCRRRIKQRAKQMHSKQRTVPVYVSRSLYSFRALWYHDRFPLLRF
jgi:hypothetical protein